MTILTPAEYPAIRAAIDLALDETTLPDAVIELPIFLAAADLDLKTRDPDWATRTGDQLTQLTNAAIYLTAARIAPSVPRLQREVFGDYSYQLQTIDWEARAAALNSMADGTLDLILDPGDTVSDRPTTFSTAAGGRGRWRPW